MNGVKGRLFRLSRSRGRFGFHRVAGLVAVCGTALWFAPTLPVSRQGTPSTEPAYGGTLTIGQPFAFRREFIPYLVSDAYTTNVWSTAFDTLLTVNNRLRFVPNLAKSWSWSKDHLTMTMTLQPDAVWSDGVPVTSDDVLLCLNYLGSKVYQTDLQGQYGSLVEPLKGYAAVSSGKETSFAEAGGFTKLTDRSFELHFSAPDAAVLDADIANITPLPAHILGAHPISQWPMLAYDSLPTVTDGPFRFTSADGTATVRLSENPKYWRGKPHIANIVYQTVNGASAVSGLKTGTIDLQENGLSYADVQELQRYPNVSVREQPSLVYDYLAAKLNHLPELKDARVRQAFEYALDRGRMVQDILHGMGKVLNGPLPSSSWMSSGADAKMNPYPYSVKRANALLGAAGWHRDKGGWRVDPRTGKVADLHLAYPFDPVRASIAHDIQRNLAAVGIHVTLDTPLDLQTFYQRVMDDAPSIQLYVAAWQIGTDPDPRGLWRSHDALNWEHWIDPINDALIRATYNEQAFDPKQRKQAFLEWQYYVNKELPLNFLFQVDNVYGLSQKLHIPSRDWSDAGPLNPSDWWLSG